MSVFFLLIWFIDRLCMCAVYVIVVVKLYVQHLICYCFFHAAVNNNIWCIQYALWYGFNLWNTSRCAQIFRARFFFLINTCYFLPFLCVYYSQLRSVLLGAKTMPKVQNVYHNSSKSQDVPLLATKFSVTTVKIIFFWRRF